MARSGVCPTVPQRDRNTYSDTPPARDQKDVPVPDAVFATCQGGTNVDVTVPARPGGSTTTITVCCPSPGPVGPKGDQGDQGDIGQGIPIGGTTGQVLAKNSNSDYDLLWAESGIGNIVWRGYWQTGILYYDNEVVSHKNSSFVCNIEHTSDSSNEPDKEFDADPGGFEWSLSSSGGTDEEKGLLDNLFDNTTDWLSDIGNWGIEDYAIAALVGGGLVWAGSALNDMFNATAAGDGQANSSYNGDAVFTGNSTPSQLSVLVAKICDHAEITNYDITQIQVPANEVSMSIPTLTSARTILQMLSNVFFFDMVDSAGTLKFISRVNQSSVRTLTESVDLGFNKSATGTSPVMIKRNQSIDLPRTLQLQFVSESQNYNIMTQEARLEAFQGGQNTKITIPITLDETRAFDIAEKLLVNSHMERTNYSFTTTYKHIDLEPGDIITVENIGDVRIIRIDERDEGLLDFQTVAADFNVENYTSSGIPSQSPPDNTQIPIVIGYSAGLSVELPPLDFTDIEQRLTLFPHGYGQAGWPGCAIYISIDGGITYSQYATATKESTWGKVAIATPTISNYFVWDEATTIDVILKSGTLSSKPASDVYNLTNWCLIGSEIIGFKTATLTAPNTYTLSGLLRGRRGSEYHIDKHVVDEVFILLDSAAIELPYAIADKEKTIFVKYVTNNSDISKATAYQMQPSQLSRRPWMVSQLKAVKSGNDWIITWLGRNQFNSDMVDSAEITNPDGFRGYNVGYVDNTSTALRNIITQGTSLTYTAADQITDFGSVQSTLTVRINQLDQYVGTGYVVEKTF